jgi:hypothetical protein
MSLLRAVKYETLGTVVGTLALVPTIGLGYAALSGLGAWLLWLWMRWCLVPTPRK